MNFLELKEQFENKITDRFELLELHYVPYSFGSGMFVYRIRGYIVKVIYDGKEDLVELLISAQHEKYSAASWTAIYSGIPTDFIENGLIYVNALEK